MSVIFATITENFIAVCADKQATNMKTGEIEVASMTKIEKWTPNIIVGGCGSSALNKIILSAVRNYSEEIGLEKISLKDMANFFCDAYYAALEEYKDMPKETSSKLMVAGKLPNGQFGAYVARVGNETTEIDVYRAKEIPVTLILEPSDLSSLECNELLGQAISVVTKNEENFKDPLEAIYRRAVKYVSKKSKFVGCESDYLFLSDGEV